MAGRRRVLLLLLVGGWILEARGSSLRQEVKALAGGSVSLRYCQMIYQGWGSL